MIKLADYLTQRDDIDSGRIGITGESLGGLLRELFKGWYLRSDDLACKFMLPLQTNAGMHAWFGAAADTRYAVVVPIIGVQVLHLIKILYLLLLKLMFS